MKRDIIICFTFMVIVLLLVTVVAMCSFGGRDAEDVVPYEGGAALVRIIAPVDTYEDDVNVRREVERVRTVEDACPYTEAEIGSVIAAAPETVAVNVYDYLDSAPLRTEVLMMIEDVCAARGVDVRVVLAIIEVESRFDESAIGDRCQSFGLMQVQPRWHGERMARLGVTDLLDGVQNVLVGVDYLDELLDRYGGDYYKALTAYNAGHYRGCVTPYAYKVMAIAGKEIG